ncbi:hypothetical protein Tco_0685969 [Tanacetum coccineum]
MISVNNLITDSENDNEIAGIPSFSPPKPTITYVDDLNFFKDFENEFLAIVYNDAQTPKSDYLTEQTLSPQHNNESDLNDETSLSEHDEVGQNVLYFNDLLPFNVIHPNDLKSNKDNDNNEIDIIQSSEGTLRALVCSLAELGDEFLISGDRWRRMSWREFILALGLYTAKEMQIVRFGAYWADSARQIPDNGGTDISKITRKQSKTGKHRHENQKSTKRSQRFKAEARKVKPTVKSSQTLVNQ